jgi:hypothetical protein
MLEGIIAWPTHPLKKGLSKQRPFKTEALQNRGAFTLAATLVCPAQRLLPIIAPLEAIPSVHEAA